MTPANWQATPPPASTRKLKDRFLANSPLPAMRVPSVIVGGEWCYVLNPAHPRFGELTLGPAEPFVFDPRVAK
ncbi:MAG: RES family NAD+ phosphorylase [Opitutaceae bacterium]|nr:RES family NAD+ phosphorylase [Opitutaceae bacterium]